MTSLQITCNNNPFLKNLKIMTKYFAADFIKLAERPLSRITMAVSNNPAKTLFRSQL